MLLFLMLFSLGCQSHKHAMGDQCPHGETRKGRFKTDKWSDIRNHQ